MTIMSGIRGWLGRVGQVAHTRDDDALAMLVGVSLITLGLALYQAAGLLSGGVAGLAFVVADSEF
jgi:uncharacterized membrane-anchored protein YitT (DUF2179 family)